jgi:hypothetical protein
MTDHIGRRRSLLICLGSPNKVSRFTSSAPKTGREELVRRYQGKFDELGIRWTRGAL